MKGNNIDSLVDYKVYVNPNELLLMKRNKLLSFGSGVDYVHVFYEGKVILEINAWAPFSSFSSKYYPYNLDLHNYKEFNGGFFDNEGFEIVKDSNLVQENEMILCLEKIWRRFN